MTAAFLPIEIAAFAFGAYAAKSAWDRGAADASTLFVGMAFGLAVEFFFVLVYTGYSYGQFLVMPAVAGHAVPLWVAVGWGTIIYTCMRTTDRLPIHWTGRALLDGLLAVSLDISLDPIAEAVGFWHWSRPSQFYGVPYDNFIGWILIVSSFSFFTRGAFLLFHPRRPWVRALCPVGALVPAVAVVAGLQYVLEAIYPHLGEPLTFFGLAALYLGITVPQVLRAHPTEGRIPLQLVVPVGFHLLFLGYLFGTGLHAREPTLVMLMPLAAIVSLLGFTAPRTEQ